MVSEGVAREVVVSAVPPPLQADAASDTTAQRKRPRLLCMITIVGRTRPTGKVRRLQGAAPGAVSAPSSNLPPMLRRVVLRLSLLVLGVGALRLAVVPAEVCPAVTVEQVRTAVDEAVAWIERGMASDGRYTYGYSRDDDVVNPGYNGARHAGVTMSLYQVALRHDPDVLDIADRGLGYMLDRLVAGDGWRAWQSSAPEVQLGDNGLFLAALALRREVTGDTRYDGLMRDVGRFVLALQQPDGRMYGAWHAGEGREIAFYGTYATGEAAWALTLLDEAFPGEGWGRAALRTLDYMATDRLRVEGGLAPIPDHWAAYTLESLSAELHHEGTIDYARRLAGYFGIRLRFESQRQGTGINLWLRWYPGPPAGVGTAGEGLGALWRLSRAEPELADLGANMEERLVCTAGTMVSRQATAEEAQAYGRPDLVQGAWFYREYSQLDDEQHVISALLAALEILEKETP